MRSRQLGCPPPCKSLEAEWGTPARYKARYPPRNLRNALAHRGPLERGVWTPVATYTEPQFPIIPGTTAFDAATALHNRTFPLDTFISSLDVLSYLYVIMGAREDAVDLWFQRRVTRAS